MAYVFISYQRSGSTVLAHFLKDTLENAGFSVYLDVEARQEIGPLEPQIMREIIDCTVFICLLETTTLSSEWVCREIETAVGADKDCLPVLHENFRIPDNADGAVKNLLSMAGERINDRTNNFFKERINRIVERVQRHAQSRRVLLPEVKLQILIVEDDDDWVGFISTALELYVSNCIITTAKTLQDAEAQLYNPFDLIILDLNLGGPNGYKDGGKLSEIIRKDSRAFPTGLLILSDLADIDLLTKVFEEHNPVFLRKINFSPEALYERVATAIRKERLHAASERASNARLFMFQFGNDGIELGGASDNLRAVQNRITFPAADYDKRFAPITSLVSSQPTLVTDDVQLKALGNEIGSMLLHDPGLRDQFQAARQDKYTRIVIAGEGTMQSAPFEIMRVNDQFSARFITIARRWRATIPNINYLSNGFVQSLAQNRKPLHIALIGSPDSDENRMVRSLCEYHLISQGIRWNIHAHVDVESFIDYLGNWGSPCDMLHITYSAAAASLFPRLAQMTALLQGRSCRFAYANFGLGMHTWAWIDRLAQAGVGSAVACQFPIDQSFAADFASRFYHAFFTTWDIAESVRYARLTFIETDVHAFSPLSIEVR